MRTATATCAVFLNLACAASTQLLEKQPTAVIPLSSSQPDPTALLCATVGTAGIVTMPCPAALGELFKYDYADKATPQGGDFALYQIKGDVLVPALQADVKIRFANERIWYGGWTIQPLARDVASHDLEALRALCGVDVQNFDSVVQHIEEGCSVTDFGAASSAGQLVWSVEGLAESQSRLGTGHFRSANPDDREFRPACVEKVPVALHLMNRSQFCANYVSPVMMRALYRNIEALKKDAEDSKAKLIAAQEQNKADSERLTRFKDRIAKLIEAKEVTTDELRDLKVRVAELETTNVAQLEDLQTAQERLVERERELTLATATLVEVLREKSVVHESPTTVSSAPTSGSLMSQAINTQPATVDSVPANASPAVPAHQH